MPTKIGPRLSLVYRPIMSVIATKVSLSVGESRRSEPSTNIPLNTAEWTEVFGPDFDPKVERALHRSRRKFKFRFFLRREILCFQVFPMDFRCALLHAGGGLVREPPK